MATAYYATICYLRYCTGDPVHHRTYTMFYVFFIVLFTDIRQSRSQVRERTGNKISMFTGNDPVIERVLALIRENNEVKYM